MSVHGHGAIEFQNDGGSWWIASEVYFYGDVDAFSVLAHPWEERGSIDPGPVVLPKGFPDDLSLMVRHKVCWFEDKRTNVHARSVSFSQIKSRKMVPYGLAYYIDPDEWVYPTWLTVDEVAAAADLYEVVKERGSPRSSEIEGALAMMRAIEAHGSFKGFEVKTRLVLWFKR